MFYKPVAALSAAAILLLTGCGGSGQNQSGVPVQSQYHSSDQAIKDHLKARPMAAAMLNDQPAGTRIYHLASVTVTDSSSSATFAATAKVLLKDGKIIVQDPSSGQTFIFAADSKISYRDDGAEIYVKPGRANPDWINSAGNAIQKVEVKQ